MRQQRCKPDLSAYTHMITAHNKAGQWRTSLQLFEQMQQANCRPDALVYSLVVDVLWNTGIASAQAKAVQVSFKAHLHGIHAKPQQKAPPGHLMRMLVAGCTHPQSAGWPLAS